ncbi:hypothetical protein BSKO_12939 [Bryopsis sp. KO-2023]|nr:hypothetical protein BSKO_12939 [Bryopsis sp. KO-2023]
MFHCDCCLTPDAKKLKEVAKRTPFTFSELLRLSTKFTELDEDGSGTLSTQELCTLPELRANPFGPRMCLLFSETGCGQLTFFQFINMMGIFCERTSLELKTIWAFAIWDFDGDDILSPEDIKEGLRLITTSSANQNHSHHSNDPSLTGGVSDSEASFASSRSKTSMLSSTRKAKQETALDPRDVDMVVERIFHEVDPMDAGLTFTDFQSVISRMPDFLENFRMTA